MSFFQMFTGLLGFGDVPKSNLLNKSKNNLPTLVNNTNKKNNTNKNNTLKNRSNANSINMNTILNTNSPMVGGKRKKTMRNKRK
jgi:hypothetical protein